MKNHLLYLGIIVIIIIFSVNNCSNKNATIQTQKDNIEAYKDSTIYLKNKKGEVVASKLALQLTEKELRKEKENNEDLKIAIQKFKKTIAVIQSRQEVKIDTILVPFKDTIPCVFERFNTITDKYYQFDLKVNQIGSIVSNFELTPNKQTFVIGEKRENFLSNSELRVDITNSNKLFNQTNVKPIVIIYQKSWYEKPQVTIPIGFILGIIVK